MHDGPRLMSNLQPQRVSDLLTPGVKILALLSRGEIDRKPEALTRDGGCGFLGGDEQLRGAMMFTVMGETGWRRVSPRASGGPAWLGWGREGGRAGDASRRAGRASARGADQRDKKK